MAGEQGAREFLYGPGIDSSLKSMTVTQVLARARRRCERCETPEPGSRGSYKHIIVYRDGKTKNVDLDNLTLVCSSCLRSDDAVITHPSKTTHPQGPTHLQAPSKMMRTTRRSQKIERVTDKLIRFRIENIKPKSVKMCVKYLYTIDGRVSEGVSVAYASDTRTTPRGPVGTDAKIDLWYPEMYSTREEAFKAQKDDGVKIVHPAVVFTVSTAKRRGRLRTVAVPLDPEMEPWAQELMRYFEQFGGDHVFPFTRQRVWERSKKVWRDLVYVIEDYSVVLDGRGMGITKIDDKTTEEKRESKRIDRHLRDWTLHACRHRKASDLVDYYNFGGSDLSQYGGWTLATAMGVGSSVGRYLDLSWRGYFAKLLRKRY